MELGFYREAWLQVEIDFWRQIGGVRRTTVQQTAALLDQSVLVINDEYKE